MHQLPWLKHNLFLGYKLIFEVVENPYQDKDKRAGLAASKMLLGKKIDSLIVNEIGPISLHALRDGIVGVYQADQQDIESATSAFADEQLTRLEEETKEKV